MLRILVFIIGVLGIVSTHAHDRTGEFATLRAEQVERALTVAEAFAKDVRPSQIDGLSGLVEILLEAPLATDINEEVFRSNLFRKSGYHASEATFLDWFEEFNRVLIAYDAISHPNSGRSIREIEAELMSLPTVPLDETDNLIREELSVELGRALVSDQERKVIQPFSDRIQALIKLASNVGKNQ